MIHMTSTYLTLSGSVFVACRCKWASGPHDTRHEARTAGDVHLAEANAPENDVVSGPVRLDETVSVLAQYSPSVRWNGWLIPSMDAWSVETVLTAVNEPFGGDTTNGYEWEWLDDGSLQLTERLHDEEPDTQILHPDEDELYSLGAYSWTWSEDRKFYDSDEHGPVPSVRERGTTYCEQSGTRVHQKGQDGRCVFCHQIISEKG